MDINNDPAKRMQDLGERGVEDMVELKELDESTILRNLKLRYLNEDIYTFIGNILVAINPYKLFNSYGLEEVKKYRGQILGTLPPHLFAIGSASHAKMSKENENQVIIISGESGSGKTETSKLIMQYLAAVNKSASNIVTEQILEACPLLESFGNAKTVKNNNSSRFGKYLEIYFKDGVITGAKTTEYLLEKSRIVTQALDERNYHVFYELLTGLSDQEKEKYGLQTAEKYFYLNQGGSTEIDGKNDEQDFRFLLAAMQVLGFTNDEQDTIFRILASVLHLGNIYFHRKQLKHGQEGVEIGSDAEIRWISHLLQLPLDGILKAITFKTTETRTERVFTPLNIDQALDSRDVLAKSLYSSLFSWLVHRINHMVYKGSRRTSLALLDIFGFEEFKENSFEQLCINFANETLHSVFIKYVFKIEQQEYIKEKIEWQHIPCPDNQNVLDLIAKKPEGILALLDDESNFPKASDHSFLEKCHYNHAVNEAYSRPRMSSMEFGIKHFAGQVWYTVDGFLDKNRDTLRPDVLELLAASKIGMISKMFQDLRSTTELGKTYHRGDGRFITMKPRAPTVATRFQDSLSTLLDNMSKCHPWFIRCIKPNNEKAPMKFDKPIVLKQLRYCGVLETVRIRQIGYSSRMKYSNFVSRYRCLIPGKKVLPNVNNKDFSKTILESFPQSSHQYQLGTTKVFMRESLERNLEKERVQILRGAVISVQKYVRGYLARKRYHQVQESATIIQSAYRGYRCRKEYNKIKKGISRAQATWRMKNQQKEYQKAKQSMAHEREAQKVAAAERVRREEKERNYRQAAAMNHELPAQLQVVLDKLDGWQPPQNDKHVCKPNEVPIGGRRPVKLPHDIDQFSFKKFANTYFRAHVFGVKKDPIKTPFLPKSSESEFQESLAIFKLILRFTKDESLSGKREKALADFIIHKGISDESLRDEILCQLCNQTWKNDDQISRHKAWLLMADALSSFSASPLLYKYLLKYVSDYGPSTFRSTCQSKLLRGALFEPQNCRIYPPTYLEHKANNNQASIALNAVYPDGDSKTSYLDSWTTGEEFAADLLRAKSIDQTSGWTVEMVDEGDIFEVNGGDFVMDLIAETEVAPSFPTCKSYFLVSPDRSKAPKMGQSVHDARGSNLMGHDFDIESESDISRKMKPPRNRLEGNLRARSASRDQIAHRGLKNGSTRSSLHNSVQSLDRNSINLSKSSKLNQRYIQAQNGDLKLSEKSRLNKRYASKQTKSKKGEPQVLPLSKRSLSLQELGLASSALNERYFHTRQQLQKSISVTSEVDEVTKNPLKGADDFRDSENLLSNQKSAFLKSQLRPSSRSSSSSISSENSNSRVVPKRIGHSSESLNSRYIKYSGKLNGKNQYSQSTKAYLDKSDRRDIEGYGYTRSSAMSDTSEAPSLASHVRNVKIPSHTADLDQYLDDLFNPVLDGNLDELSDARSLAASIKGGLSLEDVDIDVSEMDCLVQSGAMAANLKGGGTRTDAESSSRDYDASNNSGNAFTNVAGMTVPMVDTAHVIQNNLVHQKMIQRAFLASAVQQNLQIQKQLLEQNQKLQKLLETGEEAPAGPSSESLQPSLVLTTEDVHIESLRILSPQSHSSNQHSKSVPPPPPPLPPPSPPPNDGSYQDVYGRAKTVRIGKWRWPPPREESQENGGNSFLEFKMKKHDKRQDSRDDVDMRKEDLKKAPVPPVRTTSVETKEQIVLLQSKSVAKSSSAVSKHGPSVLVESKADLNVGKLRISSEMKAKLEQLTTDQSVRTGKTSSREKLTRSMDDISQANVKKLSEQRKSLLEQQLMGSMRLPPSADLKSAIEPGSIPLPPRHEPTNFDGLVKIEGRFAPHRRSGSRECRERRDELGPNRGKSQSEGAATSDHFEDSSKIDGYDGSTTSTDKKEKVKRMGVPPPPPPENLRSNGYVSRGPPSIATSSTYYQAAPVVRKNDSRLSLEKLENDSASEEVRTKQYPMDKSICLTYSKVSWELRIRKEYFTPSEKIDDPATLNLIFCQVVRDAFSRPLIRLTREEKCQIQAQLAANGVTLDNYNVPHKMSVQSAIVELAKSLPVYFSRLYPVYGGRNFPSIHFVGISHSALRFLRREKESLQVVDTLSFEVIADVTAPRRTALQILLKTGAWITLFSPKANQIRIMIEKFIMETIESEIEFVSAIEDHNVKDSTLLNFRKGDIIRIIRKKQVPKGWFFGVLESGEGGIFPEEFVTPLSSHQVALLLQNMDGLMKPQNILNGHHHQNGHGKDNHSRRSFSSVEEEIQESSCWIENKESDVVEDAKSDGTQGSQLQDGKFSLLQFALFNFKEALEKYELVRNKDGTLNESANFLESLKAKKKKKGKNDGSDWTWRQLSDLVKFSPTPIPSSLLKLNSSELTKLAVDCFISIMRYMGDHPMAKNQTEVDCVYTVLVNCHRYPQLRDEVYCQMMKQTTSNKSSNSCRRGWRLFSIIASYFDCSENLRPYLLKYLETAAYDKRRMYHNISSLCLHNLRKTFRFGGRKNVPSIEEIAAISAGRNSKRQMYRLPGGTERIINTTSTTVVLDVIEDICSMLNVRDPLEMEEFSLYCIVEGDPYTMPLNKDEYILDVTTELLKNSQVFYLIFCRSVWFYPLRLESQLYIEVVFNQVAPDYLEGLLLVTPDDKIPEECVPDISRMAALLHRAADMEHTPTRDEVKYLLPKPVLPMRDIRPPQWVEMVQSHWQDMSSLSNIEAKAQCLDILQKWPLFGSCFFAVKMIHNDSTTHADHILALNRDGVQFLHVLSHETVWRYSFAEVISTRKVRSEDGTLYLDMKTGNLMVQKITRIQTDQAHEISRLIRQYIDIQSSGKGETPPNIVTLSRNHAMPSLN